MQRLHLKSLAIPLALALVVLMSSAVGAGERKKRGGLDLGNLITSIKKDEDQKRPGSPVPEPSAALVFGVGLLVASGVARRRR